MDVKIVLFYMCLGILYNFCKAQSTSCPVPCVVVKSCSPAVTILASGDRAYARDVLKQAFCGSYDQGQPMVCCPQISANPEKHPNLKLLPASNVCGITKGDRIFGGTEAEANEFPWIVLLAYKTRRGIEFHCGGSLISDRYVLTAAHCLTNLGRSKVLSHVRVGAHVITDNDGEDIQIAETIPHPLYEANPVVHHDIGLLRLSKRVNFAGENSKTAPVCLPRTRTLRTMDLTDLEAVVAGWGTTEDGSTSNKLLKVAIPVHSEQSCRKLWIRGEANAEDLRYKFCAGKVNKDSCSGDSGGPLTIKGELNGPRYIQHGVVSYGARKCGTNIPGVYTAVRDYMGWILDHMKP